MNPSMTINYMAAQGNRARVARTPEHGWMAEQAADRCEPRRLHLLPALKRLIAATIERPRQLVRHAATVEMPVGSLSGGLDRVG